MNIIFETQFGSHLYGTNTPTSDLDIKGIFIEDMERIILDPLSPKDQLERRDIHLNTKTHTDFGLKNTKDDIDREYKELREFLKDAMAGQTYAVDMLFAPESLWQTSSFEWRFIIANRHKLLSKHVEPFIGYCRQQAGKYGLKGSRLGELQRVIKWMKEQDPKAKLGDVVANLERSEYVFDVVTVHHNGSRQELIEVLNRRLDYKSYVKHSLAVLEKLDEKYGERSKMAMKNEGVDWKAVSHAFRCALQMLELANLGEITFPLKEGVFLRDIKQAKIPYSELQDKLPVLMEHAVECVKLSPWLADEPDRKFWEDFILKTYLKK